MDRDRDRDRDRERRDDRYSNTYRPGERPRSPGPRIDSYRSARSPSRRAPLTADTYTPASRTARPRSRSPPFRRRSRSPRRDEDRYRARPRSPPRRAFSPRRDDYRTDRARSPRRDAYDSYTTRSPRPRERSPPLRERLASPARSRGVRSPPPRPGRYEEPRSRAHSPFRRFSPARDPRDIRDPRDFRRRSPSPRRDRAEPFSVDTWRRRSPSPVRPTYPSNDVSGRESAATSRRSSPPPVHPSRAALVTDDRPLVVREPLSAPRSPIRERELDREREYPHRERERSSPRHRDTPPTGPRGDREFAPPTGPSASAPTGPSASYRNGENGFPRAPPTGPAGRAYPSPAISPPIGPSNLTPQVPAYPRAHNPGLVAPTRPRGGGRGGFQYDAPREFSGPPPRRGSAHWGGRGGGGYFGGAPSGPRGSVSGASTFAPPFRGSSNSTSTTYPRTQRFRDHLADLPKEIPGGQKAPELYDKSKILKLEEEARKLREMIDAKEAVKRQRLREWDVLEREANNAALRGELAEQHLRSLTGESEGGGVAF
ncbi:hypothetical protein K505DRAFT_292731 [Melanomma pulvis-pyrius CBS 109.77]|uniref:Serine/arginine repetitive matrix protein 1 n=1 Tax=Melanomma pulvis-pyrius CBS 109.77 TaxID=1314802 RepID=A0A6A6XW71_9PLEO|nr:hypothetical protein K505DRAFT_292731 [Melanomma pulvis-pyrius CBS 109.77]